MVSPFSKNLMLASLRPRPPDRLRAHGPVVRPHHVWRPVVSDSPDIDRRRFCGAAAVTVAAGSLGLLRFHWRVSHMTATMTEATRPSASENADIRPFRVNVTDAELADLRRRVAATKWPDRETVPDTTQGVQLATMQSLAHRWAT